MCVFTCAVHMCVLHVCTCVCSRVRICVSHVYTYVCSRVHTCVFQWTRVCVPGEHMFVFRWALVCVCVPGARINVCVHVYTFVCSRVHTSVFQLDTRLCSRRTHVCYQMNTCVCVCSTCTFLYVCSRHTLCVRACTHVRSNWTRVCVPGGHMFVIR